MIVLYPSYSFETLSSDRTAEEAREILAAWSAVFHPALLEKYNEIPRWESASIPPYDVSGQPLLIPPSCESFMNEDWFQQQENGGARLVRGLADRNEITTKLLEIEGLQDHGFDTEFVADFSALALAYFLADLLVQQLHYSSMMDDGQLTTQIFDAIKMYRLGEREAANNHLKQAFEVVCQSKEYFYPVQTYFVDLTLVTETTIGEPMRKLLESRESLDLFLPSRVLEKMSEFAPETFSTLKSVSETGRVRFVIDDTEEKSLLLLPILDIADRVLEGLSIFREKLNVSPTIFGKLRTGLNPLLPQILKLVGMRGAVHFAPLNGWHLKEDAQSKMIWQGVDGTKLDALIRYPLNPLSDLDFFDLAARLGETINNDHAPTAVFAAFPGINSGATNSETWLDALRRMDRYASGLGSFTAIDRYFDDTPQCGGVKKLDFDRYPGNELSRAVAEGETDPVSQWSRVHRESVQRTIDGAFETVLALLGRKITDRPLAEQCAEAVTGKAAVSGSAANRTGLIVPNPWSFPRRVYLDVSDWPGLPKEDATVVLARSAEDRKEIVVDVPPMGYTFVEPATEETDREKSRGTGLFGRLGNVLGGSGTVKNDPPLIRKTEDEIGKGARREVFVLQNELFEAKIDAASGMLRSIFTDNYRFNRLSRQLGFRLPKEKRAEDRRTEKDPNRGYAVMAADEISVLQTGPISGRLKIRGRLIFSDGAEAARFTETVTIKRRSRLLEFDLAMEPSADPGELPWDSYFGIRYAWNDNTMDLRGCLGDGVFSLSGDRIRSPRFIDLRSEKHSLTFFGDALPFHRRFGDRQFDTILIPRGETARNFRTEIGVDLRYPVPASLEFFAQKKLPAVPVSDKPNNPSVWLFRIEAKNVVALHWEPVLLNDKPVGCRIFLLETEGRRAHFSLHSFLPPKKAVAGDLLGEELKEFKLDTDAVLIDMHARELLPLTVWFEEPEKKSESGSDPLP